MGNDRYLTEAMLEARRENALLINRVRAIGVGGFTLISGVMAFGLGLESWKAGIVVLGVYLAVSILLLIGGELSSKILCASRFAVPFFDIPMVAWVQWISIAASNEPGNVSEFSIGLFVCLLMLSALTLHASQICLSLVSVIVAEQLLQHAAGISLGGRVSSALVLLLATWICLYAGRNRIKLVTGLVKGEARRRRLQRYFSPGVGELLEEQAGGGLEQGRECELTVVFVDIRGFTAMSDRMPVRETVGLLNAYHGRMVEAVFRCGGTLDKYLGDGLMAYFNAPVGQPDHAQRALQCVSEMRRELGLLNDERLARGDVPLRMGIGVHTGRAIVGDIGAPHRREFTAIGEAVNLASRLEVMTKDLGREALVSAATVALLPEASGLVDIGEHPVRGCSGPVRLFTLPEAV